MLLKELLAYYKSWANFSRTLEMGSTTYQKWLEKGYIPYPTQCVIESKTKGLFKANKAHGLEGLKGKEM